MKEAKRSSLERIKIIEGQIRKIREMIETQKYCVDIMVQSLAVQKSLASLNRLILADHLKSCLIEQIKSGQEEKSIQELLQLYYLESKS